MKAEIITIGTPSEQVDRFLSQELAACALTVSCRQNAENAGDALRRALGDALHRSERILICGGMEEGAAETVAQVLGLPLTADETAACRLAEYTEATGTALPETLAKVPRGAVVFPNAHGPCSGFAVEKYGQTVLLLPASRGELVPLFQHAVIPYLSQKAGGAVATRTVGIFGLSQSTVTERISDLLAGSNPAVTLFSNEGGEILLRITAHAADPETAESLCVPVVNELHERLGAFVFGVDVGSLQQAVVQLLREHGMKIATAESCTAGLLSGKLTQISGASAVFECGVAAYSKEIKRDVLGVPAQVLDTEGAVSANTAIGMATGARRVGASDIGVGITGEAGPTSSEGKPVGTVFLALADNRRVWVKELHAAGDRDTVREIATCQILDLVRRYLEALPTVMAGGRLLEDKVPAAPEIPKAAATGRRRLLPAIFPWKGDTPGAIVGKSLIWAGVAAAIVVICLLLNTYVFVPARNREQYVSLELLYTGESSRADWSADDFPAGMLSRFYSLYERNPDIRGWITLPDTAVSYPVVQNGTLDYSALDFSRAPSAYGVPYFDENVALASAASVNRSYIIHGNNTGDGQMFSELLSYTDASFLLAHPTAEMNTIYRTGTYEIFAVLYVDEQDTAFDYRTVAFDSEEEFTAFCEALCARSLFVTSVQPQKGDTLLLLETDASSLTGVPGVRLVVAARQLPPDSAPAEKLNLSYNAQVILPGSMRGAAPTTTAAIPTTTTTLYQSSDEVPDIELPTEEETTTAAEAEPTAAATESTTAAATAVTDAVTETTAAFTTAAVHPETTVSPTTAAPTTATAAPATTSTTASATTTSAAATDGWPTEEQFYSTLTVKIGSNPATPIRSREELQYAVACLVKTELGAARTMQVSTEAQKAQAVAGYTYMLYSCRSGGTFSISGVIDLTNAADQKIYAAVGEVLGMKLADTAQTALSAIPLCAMYSSSVNGHTSSCQNVYTAALPYLQGVESVYDTDEYIRKYSGSDTLTATYSITWSELKAKLDAYVASQTKGAVTAVSLDAGELPLYAVSFDTGGGYVVNTNAYYVYNGKTVRLRGIDIRKAIGSSVLRSHSFTLTYDADTDLITFTTKGHGHGLGLSQYGAVGYASEAGWTWRQILNHYYSLSDTGRYRIVEPVWR